MTEDKETPTAVETANTEEGETTAVPRRSAPQEAASVPASPPAPAVASPREEIFERRAVRRGCFSIILGAVLGAFVGTALTLTVLSWLNNGLLTYNQADLGLRRQLDDEIATRQTILEAQVTAVHDVATRQAAVETEMARTLGTAEAEMAGLRVTAVYLETRIGSAGNAADTLDAFLGGLNELLSDVSSPGTPAPAMTVTGTPSPAPTASTTPTSTATP